MRKLLFYGGLLFGVLALSTSAIFVKLAQAPSAITAFYRLFFSLLVLVPMVLFHPGHQAELRKLTKKQWLLSMGSGLFLAVHYILWFESLRFTSVASSTVIVTLQPVFAMLLGYCFLKERQKRSAVVGCVIALPGSFLIGYGDFQSGLLALWGDCLALVAAAVISSYFFVGQMARKETSATVYSLLGYLGSVLFLGLYAWIRQEPFFGFSGKTWLCFLGLAIVSTIMGQFIFNLLLKWLSATTISMSILGEPIGTCLLAYFLLGERIAPKQAIGIVIILGGLGVYFFSLVQKPKERAQEKTEQTA